MNFHAVLIYLLSSSSLHMTYLQTTDVTDLSDQQNAQLIREIERMLVYCYSPDCRQRQ